MAYEGLEPFGPPAAAYNAAVVASTLGNINRAKGAPPFSVSDFMPQIARPPDRDKRAKAATVSAKLRAFFGGRR